LKTRIILSCVLVGLLIGGAELASWWWTHPKNPPAEAAYPVFPPMVADNSFTRLQPAYDEVKEQLFCSTGWMGNLGDEQTSPVTRLAWFEWNQAPTVNTLEAFKHLPEACMGSAGMKLEQIYKPRVFGETGKRLVFDSTRFRPGRGGQAIFVFKAVWVSGWDGADLRSGVIEGASFKNLRTLRIEAAKTRFRPERTRVLMASITGFPTEELAWGWFKKQALTNLRWTAPEAAPGA
jgi:hypothetical protein